MPLQCLARAGQYTENAHALAPIGAWRVAVSHAGQEMLAFEIQWLTFVERNRIRLCPLRHRERVAPFDAMRIQLQLAAPMLPIIEYRIGFPYAAFDAPQNYVGVPYGDRSRFPEFFSADARFSTQHTSEAAILDHFRLLQATDKLSLLTCVDFRQPDHLLHPLPLRSGGHSPVRVRAAGSRHFVLDPYPFDEVSISFEFPARHVKGMVFSSAAELQKEFEAAPVETLSVTVSAN